MYARGTTNGRYYYDKVRERSRSPCESALTSCARVNIKPTDRKREKTPRSVMACVCPCPSTSSGSRSLQAGRRNAVKRGDRNVGIILTIDFPRRYLTPDQYNSANPQPYTGQSPHVCRDAQFYFLPQYRCHGPRDPRRPTQGPHYTQTPPPIRSKQSRDHGNTDHTRPKHNTYTTKNKTKNRS